MNYIATRDGVELLDENADSIYMHYIATRPRAEKHGEHGLFGAEAGRLRRSHADSTVAASLVRCVS